MRVRDLPASGAIQSTDFLLRRLSAVDGGGAGEGARTGHSAESGGMTVLIKDVFG